MGYFHIIYEIFFVPSVDAAGKPPTLSRTSLAFLRLSTIRGIINLSRMRDSFNNMDHMTVDVRESESLSKVLG
jgi:hypothetical protein